MMKNIPKVAEISINSDLAAATALVNTAINAGFSTIVLKDSHLSKDDFRMLEQIYAGKAALICHYPDDAAETYHFNRNVKKGERLSMDMLTLKKSISGVTQDAVNALLWKQLLYDIEEGHPLTLGVINIDIHSNPG